MPRSASWIHASYRAHGYARRLDPVEPDVRLRRQLDADRVAGPHLAAGDHHAHDPRLADEPALGVAVERRVEEPFLDPVQLAAGIAQARHLDDRLAAEEEPRPAREPEQVEPAREDVLAHPPRIDLEALAPQLLVKLLVDQVHLAEVRL